MLTGLKNVWYSNGSIICMFVIQIPTVPDKMVLWTFLSSHGPVFKPWLEYQTFNIQTYFCYLNTWLLWYSGPHCNWITARRKIHPFLILPNTSPSYNKTSDCISLDIINDRSINNSAWINTKTLFYFNRGLNLGSHP